MSTTALEGGQSDEAKGIRVPGVRHGDEARGGSFWYGYGLSSISLTIATTSADDDAVPAADDVLVVARELGNDWLLGIALLTGGIAGHRRDPEAALSFFDEAIAAGQRTDRFTEAQSLFFRGIANLRLSNGAAAVADLSVALDLTRRIGGQYYTGTVLGAVAAVLARFGDTETALRLLGSLERARALGRFGHGLGPAPRKCAYVSVSPVTATRQSSRSA